MRAYTPRSCTIAHEGAPSRLPLRAPRSARNEKAPHEAGPSHSDDGANQAVLTLTVRRFSAPFTPNSTVPSASAKSVWSRPRPTFLPG